MKMLIVDDDELIRTAIKIKFPEAEQAQNGLEAVQFISNLNEHKQMLILMDIRMPIMDGIKATQQIKEKYPHIKILMLTTFDDRENIEKALFAGADGYMLKNDINEIVARVKSMGKSLISKVLTERENQIAEMVSQGYDNKKISNELFLSEGTVRNNIMVIMEKLNVKNRTELALKYLSF